MEARDTVDSAVYAKVKRQIEFYFGDSNYPRDAFLLGKAKEDNGWIPLDSLLTFNRLKQLTTDKQVVIDACKDSSVVAFNDDLTKIKRVKEVPIEDTYTARAVNVFGFPSENEGDITIETITDFFTEKFGKVLSVRIKRVGGKFARSALVEFETPEFAKQAVESKEVEWKTGAKLKISAKTERGAKRKAESIEEKEGKEEKDQRDQKHAFKTGVIAKVKGVASDSDRHEVREHFSRYGKVKFVEFQPEEVYIRFEDPDGPKELIQDITNNKATYKDVALEASVLEGDEETEYWKKINTVKKSNFKKGGRGGRGGRGKGNKRQRT